MFNNALTDNIVVSISFQICYATRRQKGHANICTAAASVGVACMQMYAMHIKLAQMTLYANTFKISFHLAIAILFYFTFS